jgi:hypothetical protein
LILVFLFNSEQVSVIGGQFSNLVALVILSHHVFEALQLLHLVSVAILDLVPSAMIILSLQKWNLGSDIILIHVGLIINVELLKVLSKLLWGWLADGFGLLNQIVSHLISTVVIGLVSFLVENDLIVSLEIDSFSHVFVFLESHHFLDVFLNDDNQIFEC